MFVPVIMCCSQFLGHQSTYLPCFETATCRSALFLHTQTREIKVITCDRKEHWFKQILVQINHHVLI